MSTLNPSPAPASPVPLDQSSPVPLDQSSPVPLHQSDQLSSSNMHDDPSCSALLPQLHPSSNASGSASNSRTSDVTLEDSISSSPVSRCPFPGCLMTVKLAHRPGHEVACSPLHHLLVMCRRFCTKHPEFNPFLERYYTIFDFPNSHTCALDGCLNSPSYKHKWCNEFHYLNWLSKFSILCRPRQRCQWPNCPNHVFVSLDRDIDGGDSLTVHDFCCWTHCQMYYMSRQQLSVSFTDPVENDSCCELSLEFVIEALKKYINDKSYKPNRVIVDESFFSKHPWDILNNKGHQSCWLIVKCLWSGPQRKLKTKDGYHWKQHGRRNTKSKEGVQRRHLSYLKLNGKERKSEVGSEDVSFHMVEYTLNDPQFKEYCAVKLQKGSSHKGTKDCRRSPTIEQKTWCNPSPDLDFPSFPTAPFSPSEWYGYV